ncbi:trace amine-associated receptor 8b-like isoform X1 [Hydractinia symbiolongicarpus]|uniref:trace amine-associated receptor 8b-like isoform X1 n=1 Tax=Hydractinia symbiolongicarpus TaxID=13093 RepID=UPI00254BD117|nr:trace amine-associated receptor 8b-like isoform X1 [Hydractinia symbiolongicarpus]
MTTDGNTTHRNESSYNMTTASPNLVTALTGVYEKHVIILIFISILIVVVNGLLIVAFSIEKKLRRRPANVLICSQAVTDLLTGIVFIPVFLVESYHGKMTGILFMTCYILFLSLFNLLALSTDRYLALSKPLLHHRMIDVRRTVKVIIFIWVIPLALTSIPLTWWFKPAEFKQYASKIYLSITWLFMLVLVVVMTILYLFVTRKAKRTIRYKRESIAQRSREKMASLAHKELRVVHLFGLLLFFFVAAYLPILYMNFCDLLGKPEYIPRELEIIGFYFLFFNSVVNPLLCICLKKDYFEVVAQIARIKRKSHLRSSLNSSTTRTRLHTDYEDAEYGDGNTELRRSLLDSNGARNKLKRPSTETIDMRVKLNHQNGKHNNINTSLL